MPAYRLNRGPRFGEIIHLPQSQEVNLAALLGDITVVAEEEQANRPAVDPMQPRWGVSVNRSGDYFIQLAIGNHVQHFDGYPEDAPTCFQRKDWRGNITGHATPQAIVDEYKAKKDNVFLRNRKR